MIAPFLRALPEVYRRGRAHALLPRSWAGLARCNIASTTAANFGILTVNFITGVLAARVLGPTGRGEWAAILLWPQALAFFSSGGIVEAVAYYSGRDRALAQTTAFTATVILVGISTPVAAIGFLLVPRLLVAEPGPVVYHAQWMMLLVLLTFPAVIPGTVLRGCGDIGVWNALRGVVPVSYLGLVLAAVAAPASTRLTFLTVGFLVVIAAPIPLYIWVLRRRVPGRWYFSGRCARSVLRYGALSFSAVLPGYLNGRLDQLIIAGLLPARSLAYYAIAVNWSLIVLSAGGAFSQVILPRLTGAATERDAHSRLATDARRSLVATLAAAALLAASAPLLIPLLFGRAFTPAVPVSLVLIAAAVFLASLQFLEESLRGLGRPGLPLLAELFGLAITLPGLYFAVPRLGIMGAAITSLVAYTLADIVLLAVLRRVVRFILYQPFDGRA